MERPGEEFQSNRKLDLFRPFQTAAVWIAIVRHAIIDFAVNPAGTTMAGKPVSGLKLTAKLDPEPR